MPLAGGTRPKPSPNPQGKPAAAKQRFPGEGKTPFPGKLEIRNAPTSRKPTDVPKASSCGHMPSIKWANSALEPTQIPKTAVAIPMGGKGLPMAK